jgi:hypothetical protein
MSNLKCKTIQWFSRIIIRMILNGAVMNNWLIRWNCLIELSMEYLPYFLNNRKLGKWRNSIILNVHLSLKEDRCKKTIWKILYTLTLMMSMKKKMKRNMIRDILITMGYKWIPLKRILTEATRKIGIIKKVV